MGIVQFDLELIVDIDPRIMNSENEQKLSAVTEAVRERVDENYPALHLKSGVIVYGHSGGEFRGPHLHGQGSVKEFKNIFGPNIARGFTLLMGPIGPVEAYTKWYQVGELFVPLDLQDLVSNVYITRIGTGSFNELDFFRPKEAKY